MLRKVPSDHEYDPRPTRFILAQDPSFERSERLDHGIIERRRPAWHEATVRRLDLARRLTLEHGLPNVVELIEAHATAPGDTVLLEHGAPEAPFHVVLDGGHRAAAIEHNRQFGE